jgi:hypothetical protein
MPNIEKKYRGFFGLQEVEFFSAVIAETRVSIAKEHRVERIRGKISSRSSCQTLVNGIRILLKEASGSIRKKWN